jgi:hypothetical protein
LGRRGSKGLKLKYILISIAIFVFVLRILTIPDTIKIEIAGCTDPLILRGNLVREFYQAYKKSRKIKAKYCLNAPHKITILAKLFSFDLNFFDGSNIYLTNKGKAIIPSEQLKSLLNSYVEQMQTANKQGELVNWEIVNGLFPRYTYAWIEDVETGLRFRVQRRAGRDHADVQPLTAEDTEIMKRIYGGKWSWKRRAVIVEIGTRRIAGSMNGMPHGAGQIKGNNFNGHFCLHFLGSKTHVSGGQDLAHQMMVWKAAGRIEEFIDASGPNEVVFIFFTALDQDSPAIAWKALNKSLEGEELNNWLNKLSSIRIVGLSSVGEEEFAKHYKVDVLYNFTGESKSRRKEIKVIVQQIEGKAWRINADTLRELWENEK